MNRVLIVTTIGGFLPQFEMNNVRLLQERGCEVHYASNFAHPVYRFDAKELKQKGIRLHPIPVEKSPFCFRSNLRTILRLRQIIDREGITMVHCHNPMGGVTARIAAAWSRSKPYVIYTAHGLHFYKGAPLWYWLLYYPVERLLARVTDCLITINREDRKNAKRLPLRHRGNVWQICGAGVDAKRFRPEPSDQRRELGIPEDAFHIVTAAELNDNKNQRVVIEALSRLNDDSIRYSLCGRGRRKRDLLRLIRDRGLEKNVHLLGYRTDMEEILRTADAFAFPSIREGFGIAAVEALLSGVPLIASDNRGTREYALNGENAILCRAGYPEDFADAIRRLKEDPGLRDSLAEKARASAMKFSGENVEATMRKIYESVLKTINEGKR